MVWMNERMNEWKKKWMNEWLNKRKNKQIDELVCNQIKICNERKEILILRLSKHAFMRVPAGHAFR